MNSRQVRIRKSKFIIVATICLITSAFAQMAHIKGVHHLPKQYRTEITARLNLLIEYDRTGQFEAQYDLLDKEIISKTRMTKNDYVLRQKARVNDIGIIQSIDIEKVNILDSSHIGISGMAKMPLKNKPISRYIGIVAAFQDGQWNLGFGFPEI